MAKSELGTKRIDPETGRKFYDLNKDPIVSPYTGKSYPRSYFESGTDKVVEEEEEVEEKEVDAEDEAPEVISLEEADDDAKAATIFPRSKTKRTSISATMTRTPSSRKKKRKTTTSPTSSASARTRTRSEIFGARVRSRAQPVYPLRHNRCRFRRPFPNAVPNKRAGRLDIAVRRR